MCVSASQPDRHSRRQGKRQPRKQQGAVLLVSVILLLIVTVIGLGSMQSVMLEEKMVSNMQNMTLAYHGAEAGLSTCESELQFPPAGYAAYNIGSLPDSWHERESLWQQIGSPSSYTGLPQEPLCVAEFVGMGGSDIDIKSSSYQAGAAAARPVFRVTSLSQGGNPRSNAMLESMFICPGGCDDVHAVDYGSP